MVVCMQYICQTTEQSGIGSSFKNNFRKLNVKRTFTYIHTYRHTTMLTVLEIDIDVAFEQERLSNSQTIFIALLRIFFMLLPDVSITIWVFLCVHICRHTQDLVCIDFLERMCVHKYFYVYECIKIYTILIKLCNYFKKVFLKNTIIRSIKAFMIAPKSI